MKRFISDAISLLVASCLCLTACSGGAKGKNSSATDSQKPVKLTFWAGVVTPDRDAVFKQFVSQVHAKYPNITVDYLGVPGTWQAYDQKLDMAVSADDAPDITNHFVARRINNKYYLPLDSYFNAWSGKSNVNSTLVQDTRNYDQKGHKLYGLPYGTQVQIIWERSDILKSANVSTPTTWDSFFGDVKNLTDKSKGQYGMSIRGGSGSASELEFLMYAYSGITNYFDGKGKSTINDPQNVDFVEKYLSMYNVYTPQDDLTKTWTQLASSFQTGKAVFVPHNLGSGSSMAQAFNNDASKFAAIAFPASQKGYVLHSGLQPSALSISAKTANKQAAFDAVSVYLDTDMQVAYSKVWGEIPANKEAGNDSFFKDTPYMQVGLKLINSGSTKFADTPYYLPNYTSIETQMEPSIQKVMSKQMTAKAMLDQWAELLTKDKAAYDAQIKNNSSNS